MEVLLDVPPECDILGECLVGMNVGNIYKQTRLTSSHLLKFPACDSEVQYGRLEVFKRVGACSMTFGLETVEQQEVQIPCSEGGLKEIRLRMSISNPEQIAPSEEVVQKANRAKRKADAVVEYLKEHQLEEILSEGMKLLMRDKPKNPHRFLANHLLLNQPSEKPRCKKSATTTVQQQGT